MIHFFNNLTQKLFQYQGIGKSFIIDRQTSEIILIQGLTKPIFGKVFIGFRKMWLWTIL